MKKALVVLAEGFEELEAVTCMDLLVRAGVEVVRAGITAGPVKASRHTVILPDAVLSDVVGQDYDVIVLPGGLPGADYLAQDETLLARLRDQVGKNKIVAAICAAPRALVAAGVVEGKTIKCFPSALDGVENKTFQLTSNAIQVDLPIVTSRGPGTAIDFALQLIELIVDKAKRDEVEKQLAR